MANPAFLEMGRTMARIESDRLRQLAASKEEYDQYVRDRAKVMWLLNKFREHLGENADNIIARFWWYRAEDQDTVEWNPGSLREEDLMNEEIAPAINKLAKAIRTHAATVSKSQAQITLAVEALLAELRHTQQTEPQKESAQDRSPSHPEAEHPGDSELD